MLVLSRKTGEKIQIGDEITLSVVRVQGNRVKIGIDAPRHVAITRQEIMEDIQTSEGTEFFCLADCELELMN